MAFVGTRTYGPDPSPIVKTKAVSELQSRIAPENFALLRQTAHNLLKQESCRGINVRRKINKAGWDNEFLLRILLGV